MRNHDDDVYFAVPTSARAPRLPNIAIVAITVAVGLCVAALSVSRSPLHALQTWAALDADAADDDLWYGPTTFEADAGAALNNFSTTGRNVSPQKVFFRSSDSGEKRRFGSVQFSNASAWNGGVSRFTLGFVLADEAGVQRDIHWHARGDEWAYGPPPPPTPALRARTLAAPFVLSAQSSRASGPSPWPRRRPSRARVDLAPCHGEQRTVSPVWTRFGTSRKRAVDRTAAAATPLRCLRVAQTMIEPPPAQRHACCRG